MINFYSEYYEKEITLDNEVQETLFDIYSKVANTKGFEPEVNSPEEINNSDLYDHVAYHVETFGSPYAGYRDIEYLFED